MRLFKSFAHIDVALFCAALGLSLLGLFTMRSFSAENAFFEKQIVWIALAVAVFIVASMFEYGFLRRTPVITALYASVVVLMMLVLSFGALVKGAQNRFNLGLLSLQPSDPAKLILVVLLSKYFARRHIEIARFRHIILSGAYADLVTWGVIVPPARRWPTEAGLRLLEQT
jgi:cell division protein FtsW (lipid II flippase)